MGNITNMQNVANSSRNMKSYIKRGIKEKQNKPRLKVTGIKDIATLLGPNAKDYKLSHNQRNFQLAGRTTIAAIAAALAITGGVAYTGAHSSNINNTEYSSETQTLDKDDVLSYAENRLMTIVYKNNLSNLDSSYVKYSHDDNFNIDKLEIHNKIKYSGNTTKKFSYTRYNNPEDKYLNGKIHNNPEISALLDFMIDIRNNPNPSQEDLENLENMASKLNLNDFVLNSDNRGNTSIVNEDEIDLGYEIGD